MTKLGIGQAWADSLTFLRQERRLVVPILLAFVFLPLALVRTFLPQATNLASLMRGDVSMTSTAIIYLLLFVEFVGALTLILLALGRSGALGELIATAARRTLILLLALLLIGLIAIPVILGAMLPLVLGGGVADPNNLPPQAALASALLAGLLILFGLRMLLMIPAIASEPIGPWAGIKRGWTLGRGNGGRLIGTFAALWFASTLTNLAVGSAVGVMARLLLGSDSGATLGGLLVTMAVGLVSCIFFAIQNAMIAMLYRQASAAR